MTSSLDAPPNKSHPKLVTECSEPPLWNINCPIWRSNLQTISRRDFNGHIHTTRHSGNDSLIAKSCKPRISAYHSSIVLGTSDQSVDVKKEKSKPIVLPSNEDFTNNNITRYGQISKEMTSSPLVYADAPKKAKSNYQDNYYKKPLRLREKHVCKHVPLKSCWVENPIQSIYGSDYSYQPSDKNSNLDNLQEKFVQNRQKTISWNTLPKLTAHQQLAITNFNGKLNSNSALPLATQYNSDFSFEKYRSAQEANRSRHTLVRRATDQNGYRFAARRAAADNSQINSSLYQDSYIGKQLEELSQYHPFKAVPSSGYLEKSLYANQMCKMNPYIENKQPVITEIIK